MSEFAFKDLHVWQRAVDFADQVISETENLNSDKKHFKLIEQIEAAAASISLNIAEGKGRQSKKEFVQFLYIARGSLYETITLLNIFSKRNWIDQKTLDKYEEEGAEIVKMIKGLINAINKVED